MSKPLQYQDCLTNELLLKRFKSQFDLVRFAINYAKNKILTDTDLVGNENIASEVLQEIADGADQLPGFEKMPEKVELAALEEKVEEIIQPNKGRKKVKV